MIKRFNTTTEFFAEIVSGKKTFLIINTETGEDVKEGDLVAVNEWDCESKAYTDRSVLVYVDYIQEGKEYLRPGCKAVGIKPCYVQKAESPYNPCKLTRDYGVPVIERVVEKS